MKRKHRLPLLPRHGVYLPAFGYGDDARFARVFRHTWPLLPLYARRTLLKQWRESEWPMRPMIEVLPFWSNRQTCVLGECYGHHLFRFWAKAVDALPDDLLAVLIAHELAHDVYPDEEEFDLREKNVMWGFDEYALDDWIAANIATLSE